MIVVSSWLADATGRLRAADFDAARAEAERLAGHVLGCGWSGVWTRLRDPLTPEQRGALDASLGRRLDDEPLAYILGTAVFHDLELEVGPSVLVPRPETETLVDVALRLLDGVVRPTVADIGTGSGAIALAIASKRPDARVVATDVSREAVACAIRNAGRVGLDVDVRHGDLLCALAGEDRGRVDLVVSNPPYVGDGESVARDVRREPRTAVFAGPTGDEVLERLISGTRAWLTPRGAIALEVGSAAQAARIVARLGDWSSRAVEQDALGRPRVVWARYNDSEHVSRSSAPASES